MMNIKYLSIMRLGAIALIAGALTACGGGGDDSTTTTPPPPPPVTTSGDFDGLTATVDPLDPATLGALTSVTIKSPPVITFKLRDSAGNPVLPARLTQVRFALAKFIPGAPDRWVPFGVKTPTTPDPTKFMVSNENRSCGQTRGTADWVFDNVKYDATTAVYTYYFCTDVTTHPDWNAGATYRMGAEVQFNDPVTLKVATTNPYVDFTLNQGIGQPIEDSTGKDKLVRQMVVRASCNSCHNDLGQLLKPDGTAKFHGNRRIDPNYCVLCHNDSGFDPVTAESLDIKTMIHKFHMGSRLTGSYAPSGLDATKMHFPQDQRNCTKCHTDAAIEGNPNVTAQGGNWKLVPSRNACGSCHDGIDFATGGGTTLDPDLPWATIGHVGGAQADDSRCADCHSPSQIAGINHIPVTKVTNSTSGVTTYYASNDGRLPAGAHTVDYQIQSVSVNASGNPVMVFRMLQDGARLDLNTATGISDGAMWTNFYGGPTAYFAYSVPQDGVATPADFNAYFNISILGVWNGSVTAGTGTLTGPDANGFYTVTVTNRVIPANASMLTGALGYAAMYQTNVAGYLRTCPPTPGATNCSNGLNVTAQDVSMTATGFTPRRITAEAERCNNCHAKLGLFAETTFHSGQRNDPKMCAMCHNPNRTSSGWSADSTAFVHGIHGASKRSVLYNWHSVVTDANGVSLPSSTPLTGTEIVSTFGEIGFPGRLTNCLNCHAPGGYDFSAGLGQVANRLHRTTAAGTMAAVNTVGTLSLSPYVTAGTTYGTGYTSSDATTVPVNVGATLVNSPIANACFGCHDGQTTADPSLSVKTHIESNGGGSIYRTRAFALTRQESCLLCHGPTQVVPIKGAHGL